jgi:CheY-like chemotaxis protein
VLIVEHDQRARRKLRQQLEGWGHDVVEAGSVTPRRWSSSSAPNGFRLVLTKVEMPGCRGLH